MMKKLISLFVSICLLLSLTACVIKHNSDVEGTTATEILTEVITSEPAETVVTEATTGFIPSPEAPILDFDVTGFDLVEDYEGNPALAVYLIWTNTTDETRMFAATYGVSAFQDGIGLNPATLILEDDGDLFGNAMTEIRPGATIEVMTSFALRSDTPIVEIEIDDFIDFDGKPLMLLTVDTSAKG